MPASDTASKEIPREVVAQVAAYFDAWVEVRTSTLQLPGVQLAMLVEDEIVLSSTHGSADLEKSTPLRTDSLFRVASHSKTFTATAIMQLLERGRLRLDDSMGTWLPELAESAPALTDVTIRELLAHGGGVLRDGPDGDYWQLYRNFPDASELPAMLASQPATYEPNEQFKYSNVGYTLLGAIVEAASGQPYNSYVTEQIVVPLGLGNTGPEYDPARADDYATGYTNPVLGLPRLPIENVGTGAMSSATGFYSTAEDLCRYAAAHFFGDDRLVTDRSKRLMQRDEWQPNSDTGHYGLGFMSQVIAERRVVGHSGGFPGQSTKTLLDPKARIAVSVLVNTVGAPVGALTEGAYKLLNLAVASHKSATTPSGSTADGSASDLDRFCGRFVNLWAILDVVRLGSQLYALWPNSPDPTAEAAKLEPVGPGQLRLTGASGYDSDGEVMDFEFDTSGEPVRVRANSRWTMHRLDAVQEALAGVDRIEIGAPWASPDRNRPGVA